MTVAGVMGTENHSGSFLQPRFSVRENGVHKQTHQALCEAQERSTDSVGHGLGPPGPAASVQTVAGVGSQLQGQQRAPQEPWGSSKAVAGSSEGSSKLWREQMEPQRRQLRRFRRSIIQVGKSR